MTENESLSVVREQPARELSGTRIDEIVRFPWRFPESQVQAVVTGVLREIHHDGDVCVYLHVIPVDADSLEVGHDKQEFSVQPETVIELLR